MAKQRRKAKATASIVAVVDIKTGPVSPAQLKSWQDLWQKLIAEAKHGQ